MKARRRKGATAPRLAASRRRARGFTLVELMIAVAVLVVIIVATSKIFGTAGKVTSLGQATADVLQETTAIERQLRRDFERLAPNGVFAIRCVSVQNDINVPLGPLLNPALPEDATIRADQLLFFTNGVQSIQTYRQGSGSRHKGQGTAARVYYGHAFQLPEAGAVDTGPAEYVLAHDPDVEDPPMTPWHLGPYDMVTTVFRQNLDGPPFDYDEDDEPGMIDATQPVAPQWLLARHAVVLADDGGSPVVYLFTLQEGGNRSALTIWDDVVRNGRVDAAAGQLNDIRNEILFDPSGNARPWNDSFGAVPDQRRIIASAVFYPRAERVAPGMHRVDQALTNNVLSSACSSFIVDWTYEDGVGFTPNPNDPNNPYLGVGIDPAGEQPWFGMPDPLTGDPDPERGVAPFATWSTPGDTVFQENIDALPVETPPGSGVYVYEAIFGYNQDTPLDLNGQPHVDLGYTPWPSAIRITMVLHDPATKLEVGREVQFVITLPKRVQ